jgi:hypothetical protein
MANKDTKTNGRAYMFISRAYVHPGVKLLSLRTCPGAALMDIPKELDELILECKYTIE